MRGTMESEGELAWWPRSIDPQTPPANWITGGKDMSKAGAETMHRPHTPEAICAHHWVIESPSGPTSRGLCALCGAENDFPNYVQYPAGNDIRFKTRSRNGSKDPQSTRPALHTAGPKESARRQSRTRSSRRLRAAERI